MNTPLHTTASTRELTLRRSAALATPTDLGEAASRDVAGVLTPRWPTCSRST
jgi:hypothetical protein